MNICWGLRSIPRTRRINYSALHGKCSRDRQRCYSRRNFLTLKLLRRKTGPNDSSIHDEEFLVSQNQLWTVYAEENHVRIKSGTQDSFPEAHDATPGFFGIVGGLSFAAWACALRLLGLASGGPPLARRLGLRNSLHLAQPLGLSAARKLLWSGKGMDGLRVMSQTP